MIKVLVLFFKQFVIELFEEDWVLVYSLSINLTIPKVTIIRCQMVYSWAKMNQV